MHFRHPVRVYNASELFQFKNVLVIYTQKTTKMNLCFNESCLESKAAESFDQKVKTFAKIVLVVCDWRQLANASITLRMSIWLQ